MALMSCLQTRENREAWLDPVAIGFGCKGMQTDHAFACGGASKTRRSSIGTPMIAGARKLLMRGFH